MQKSGVGIDAERLRYKSARHKVTYTQTANYKKRATFVALFSYTDNYIISELYYSSVSSATSSVSSGTGSKAFTLRLIFLSAALHSTTAASTVSPTL